MFGSRSRGGLPTPSETPHAVASFRRSQPGYFALAMSAATVSFGVFYAAASTNPATVVLSAVMAVVVGGAGAAFSALNVRVAGGRISWSLGPGLFRRGVDLADVVHARIITVSPMEGWGIREVAGGTLYRVDGERVVELALGTGRSVFLGTDRPEELLAAVLAARRAVGKE